jgi:hypothetical protein
VTRQHIKGEDHGTRGLDEEVREVLDREGVLAPELLATSLGRTVAVQDGSAAVELLVQDREDLGREVYRLVRESVEARDAEGDRVADLVERGRVLTARPLPGREVGATLRA